MNSQIPLRNTHIMYTDHVRTPSLTPSHRRLHDYDSPSLNPRPEREKYKDEKHVTGPLNSLRPILQSLKELGQTLDGTK